MDLDFQVCQLLQRRNVRNFHTEMPETRHFEVVADFADNVRHTDIFIAFVASSSQLLGHDLNLRDRVRVANDWTMRHLRLYRDLTERVAILQQSVVVLISSLQHVCLQLLSGVAVDVSPRNREIVKPYSNSIVLQDLFYAVSQATRSVHLTCSDQTSLARLLSRHAVLCPEHIEINAAALSTGYVLLPSLT